jgi:hypothetical protein
LQNYKRLQLLVFALNNEIDLQNYSSKHHHFIVSRIEI